MEAPALLSAREIGGRNRALVLQTLASRGPLSRSDLARLAGVSRGTIGSIVGGLVHDGLLQEGDAVGRGVVGKPSRPLWFAPGAAATLAVEVGPTAVRAATVDASGSVGAVTGVAIADPAQPVEVVRAAHRAIDAVAGTARHLGIGVAVPGACDPRTGAVVASNRVPGAVGAGLADALVERTGLPVALENDSAALALAELWFGHGRGRTDLVAVMTGEGIGAGLVVDGEVRRGAHRSAGEVGHMVVAEGGDECTCGSRGCWETIASTGWLRRQASDAGLPSARRMDAERLRSLVTRGHAGAASLLDRYAANLALGLANLDHLLAPQAIVLHGDAVAGGEAFRRSIELAVHGRTRSDVAVIRSDLGSDATLVGAGAAVLAAELHRC